MSYRRQPDISLIYNINNLLNKAVMRAGSKKPGKNHPWGDYKRGMKNI